MRSFVADKWGIELIEKLQDLFILLLKPWIPIVGRISDKVKYRLITLCFVTDLVLFCIVRYGLHKESYFYNTVCGIFLMFAIAVLSLDRSLVHIRWRRSLWIAWFGMCLSFTVSDILVPKKMCGLGLILALVFTAVFFVWQNHTRKDLLWKCFKDAVKWSFWIMAVVSFMFRPLYEGGRYAGIFTNPNTFGLYLYTIIAVFLSDLDWGVETGRSYRKNISTYFGLALCFFYLEKSQARTSLVAVAAIVLMWLVLRFYLSKKQHSFRVFLCNTFLTVVFTVVLYTVFLFTLMHLPDLVGHPFVFEGQPLYYTSELQDTSSDPGEVVVPEYKDLESAETKKTEDGKEPIVPKNSWERFWYNIKYSKGLNAITNGRIDIYLAYLEKMNYKGHRNTSMVVDGEKKNHSHNNWIQFGYTYGLFSMFFYGVITLLGVAFSLKFYLTQRRKNATYAFLVPAICVGFVVATLTECLFLPFEVFPAFAYWFAFGDLFVKKVPKNKFLQEMEGEREEELHDLT